MSTTHQLDNQRQQQLPITKADAKELARKIKGAAYAAHGHIEQAGKWLIEFRDREAWKALGYKSWTACVEEEFATTHGGRAHVFRLIQNAEVVENIVDFGQNPTVTRSGSTKVSRQLATNFAIPVALTRHLAKLAALDQRATFQRAVALGKGKPTEANIRQAVDEALKAARPAKEIQRDKTGYAIPEENMDLWNRRDEVKEILSAISKTRCAVRVAMEKNDPLFIPSNLDAALASLNSAYDAMEVSVPYAVCPTCQGKGRETCAGCKGRGFISELHFDTCVPEELKAIRVASCVVL